MRSDAIGGQGLLDQNQLPEGIANKGWFRKLGIASVLIAIPTAILSLPPVQDQVFQRDPKIGVELSSEIPVLDIRRPMQGLSIRLNGSELDASRESLVATRVTIRNYGKTGIKSNDISQSDPLGFQIRGGSIVEITGFQASTSHLRKLAKPSRHYNSITINSGVIIDPGDSLVFDILVRKPRGSSIDIFSLGKISNLKNIKVSDYRQTGKNENFLEKAFSGQVSIQIARIIAYFIMALSFIAGSIYIFTTIDSKIDNSRTKKRKSVSEKFISESRHRNKISDSLAAALYYVFGIEGVKIVLSNIRSLSTSSQIGKIGDSKIKDPMRLNEYDPDFVGFSSFLDSFMTNPRSIERVEKQLNLVDPERKNVQQAYVASLEAIALLAEAVDEKGKLRSSRTLSNREARLFEMSGEQIEGLTRHSVSE